LCLISVAKEIENVSARLFNVHHIHQKSVYSHLISNLLLTLPLKKQLSHIVQGCRKSDPKSQKELYDRYAPLFLSMALRYTKQYEEAEDVMIHAFYKIFDKIDSFNGDGSFEGWMKRILVNEALMHIRKRNNLSLAVEVKDIDVPETTNVVDQLQYEDLLVLLEQLPVGYRTIFNLYVIEGYKHREIAELLEISINTSKSQLILAKKRMRKLIEAFEVKKKENSNQQIS